MKVVSRKTLFATILGLGFLIYKIISFEEIFDIFWIVLFGHLVIKGTKISFSQEAYDDDVKRAEYEKKMMSELFGKFAPFVYWVPHILIALGVVIALLMPDRMWNERSVVIFIFLAAATLYAIWYFGKIAEYKRNKKEQQKNEK